MTEAGAAEVAVRDPLTQVTRHERRFLLSVSIIGIAFVKTGLVPLLRFRLSGLSSPEPIKSLFSQSWVWL